MLEELLSDLNGMLSHKGENAHEKLNKLLYCNVGQYVLQGYDYNPDKELLSLRLSRRSDGVIVTRHLVAKTPIFSLDDQVFYNHLCDVIERLDLMAG